MADELFLFTELAALVDGAPFDGMAFGKFRDMLGREIELKQDDAQAYADNTAGAIEATRAESGELVGLPIDAKDHDKGAAAGWIVGVQLAGSIIRLIPKWTEIGQELISKGIMRFFSPTVNTKDKVILGGSLTNWPASTDATGRLLLRPIELSSIRKISEETMTDATEQVEQEIDEAADNAHENTSSNGNGTGLDLTELRQQIRDDVRAELRAEYENQLRQERAANHVADFARRITGGTIDNPVGLPVAAEDLQGFLLSLSPEQREQAEGLFTQVVDAGLVAFDEVGHGKRKDTGKAELDNAYRPILRQWLAGGNDLQSWFELNPEVGEMERYDLSAFTEDK